MAAEKLPPFTVPEQYDEKSLALLLERAKLIEAEALKDNNTIVTKVGVGFAGCVAIFGGMMTARETLFFGLGSDNIQAMSLLAGAVILIVTAMASFFTAYQPNETFMPPNLENVEEVEWFLSASLVETQSALLRGISQHVKDIEDSLEAKNELIERGFICLSLAIGILVLLAVYNSGVKSEAERLEKAAEALGKGECYERITPGQRQSTASPAKPNPAPSEGRLCPQGAWGNPSD